MNSENQDLILLTGKLFYQLHTHEKNGNPSCPETAYAYMAKVEDALNKMDEACASPTSGKLYIVK